MGGFIDEIRDLESLIANLTSPPTSPGQKHGKKNKSHRSFGFQKLRLRHTGKKKLASANSEETKGELMERANALQGICRDLTERLKEDELINSTTSAAENTNMDESRDDDEIMNFRRRVDEEEERREEERNELMVAIAACEKVLSKFSNNADIKKAESNIGRNKSNENEIEMTESNFIETSVKEEEPNKLAEHDAEPSDEVQLTESESAANTSSFISCDTSNFIIIEMIESLVRYLVGDGNQEEKEEEKEKVEKEEEEPEGAAVGEQEEQEATDVKTERNSIQNCYCDVSKLWNVEGDLEVSPEENSSQTENEASMNTLTSTETTVCQIKPTKQQKNSSESSAADAKIETKNLVSLKVDTIYPEEENQGNENPDMGADPTDGNSRNEDGVTSSLDCDLFNSLCAMQRTNTNAEAVKDAAPADKKPHEDDKLDPPRAFESTKTPTEAYENPNSTDGTPQKKNEFTAPLDCALFNPLCSLESANTDTFEEVAEDTKPIDENSQKEDDVTTLLDCEPIIYICALEDTDSFVEVTKNSTNKRSLVREISSPTLSAVKSTDTEVLTLGTSTFGDARTLAGTSTFGDARTLGTIDNGIFTSLDSLVGAKYRDDPVENEELLDTIDAEQYVTSAVKEAVLTTVANVYDFQVCVVPSADLQDSGDEHAIATVSTMDFIPSIEVVGVKKPEETSAINKIVRFKKSNNLGHDGKALTVKKIDSKNIVDNEGPTEIEEDQQQIKAVTSISTMDFIPRLEVVGFKSTRKDLRGKRKQSRRRSRVPKKERVTKEKESSPKKAESRTRKITQKEYRRTAAKKRREQRKSKITPKEGNDSNALPLGTIQEALEHIEQPSLDSASAKETVKRRGTMINRDTPKTLGENPENELPPPLLAGLVDFLLPASPQNTTLPDIPKKQKLPISPRSELSGYDQSPTSDDDLLNTTTSSLTAWTPAVKEINVKHEEDDDGYYAYDDDDDAPKKKSWFFQRQKKEEHADIMECLTPVLSIPAIATNGTRYGDNDDDEYVNRYYNFSQDGDPAKDSDCEEYSDEYNHESDVYNSEAERGDDEYGKF